MQMGNTPTHGNLNRVMKVGNAVIAPQEQSPPDHRANTTQDHHELGTHNISAPGIETYCIAIDYAAKRCPQFGGLA